MRNCDDTYDEIRRQEALFTSVLAEVDDTGLAAHTGRLEVYRTVNEIRNALRSVDDTATADSEKVDDAESGKLATMKLEQRDQHMHLFLTKFRPQLALNTNTRLNLHTDHLLANQVKT